MKRRPPLLIVLLLLVAGAIVNVGGRWPTRPEGRDMDKRLVF